MRQVAVATASTPFNVDGVAVLDPTTGLPSSVDTGSDATGVVQLAGGVGVRGWLSGLFSLFSNGGAKVGNNTVNASASKVRPANTTAYATGQLVADNVTAGSVTPFSLTAARVAAGSGVIRKVRLTKTSTGIANAAFRVHFFSAAPTVTNGDGGTFLPNGVANYLGSADITMDRALSDGAWGASDVGMTDISFKLSSGTTVYALIEARAAYTPTSAETFTVIVEALQD